MVTVMNVCAELAAALFPANRSTPRDNQCECDRPTPEQHYENEEPELSIESAGLFGTSIIWRL
jgi:hypothetical protein